MTDPNGPVAALTRQGLETPLWAPTELRQGRTYQYRCAFVGTRALLPLAHLAVDGWDVIIRPQSGQITLRITRHGEQKDDL